MAQIFEENDSFAGLTIRQKLSRHHDGEREVYLASDTEGNDVVLTVFDLRSKRYSAERSEASKRQPDFIEEVRFLKNNAKLKGVPSFIESGITSHRRHRYGWITQKYFKGDTLETLINNGERFTLSEARYIFERMAEVIEAVYRFTQGGGHYNISPGNILLNRNETGEPDIALIGFTNIGESYNGSSSIDDTTLDNRFRAPETLKGIFSHRSDLYSLGMVMLAMLTGFPATAYAGGPTSEMPSINEQAEVSPVEYHKIVWSGAESELPSSIRMILHKATDLTPSARFGNIEKFKSFISKYIRPEVPLRTEATKEKSTETENPAPAPSAVSHALDEVAGMSELKALFRRDFIRIVQNPKIAKAYGIKPSNCTLLYGPQGCGKSFIAERAAKESGLRYKVVNPSELGSIYVHGAQQKIAETFAEAEKKGPMILIFDEFDALVPKRNSEMNPNQANEVNEMLTQMNNCAERGIYVIATTNRPCDLDPAILRRGRIDQSIYVPMPDFEARKELFRLELANRPCDENMDFERLANVTEHYTCSDISYIVAEVSRQCFEDTLDKALDTPVPISMQRLIDVAEATVPSVSEAQRKDFLNLKERMENRAGKDTRKKVGFLTNS
ncbi:MAG: AAA family ATPase [Muribaculaceae bacterium]|nr:AAA family ATPase [Muribaculaceae bacterium]